MENHEVQTDDDGPLRLIVCGRCGEFRENWIVTRDGPVCQECDDEEGEADTPLFVPELGGESG